MTKLVVFGPFGGFPAISLDWDGGRGLMYMPEVVGGASYTPEAVGGANYMCLRQWAGLHGYTRGVSHFQHQMALFKFLILINPTQY